MKIYIDYTIVTFFFFRYITDKIENDWKYLKILQYFYNIFYWCCQYIRYIIYWVSIDFRYEYRHILLAYVLFRGMSESISQLVTGDHLNIQHVKNLLDAISFSRHSTGTTAE